MSNFHIKRYFVTAFVIILVTFTNCKSKNIERRSILDKLHRGIKYAAHIFASDVANLISKSFSNTKPMVSYSNTSNKPKQQDYHMKRLNFSNIAESLLQYIHFDVSKLGTLALSVIIGIAETIVRIVLSKTKYEMQFKNDFKSENVEGKNKSNDIYFFNDFNLLQRFLQQPSMKFRNLLDKAAARELPEFLILMIENEEMEIHETDCVKMLICKCAPFIWSMQKSLATYLANNTLKEDHLNYSESQTGMNFTRNMFNVNALFKDLPAKEEFLTHGKLCSERYGNFCNITIPSTGNNNNNNC